ncbi:hypothetical protein HID58_030065, partial [Brassica napus]
MGKYMKKSKITNNDTEPTEPTFLGVRTRDAKTLALKRLNSSASDSALAGDSSCYLQLHSRRLEKPPALTEPKQPPRIKEPGSKGRVSSGSGSVHNSPDFQSIQRFVISCPSDSSSYQFDETHFFEFESRPPFVFCVIASFAQTVK